MVGHCSSLKEAGFVLIVVSNQPDIRHDFVESVEKINAYLSKHVPVDRFIMCYHDSGDHCDCRKPAPGMLFSGAKNLASKMASSYMVATAGRMWKPASVPVYYRIC